MDNDDDDYVKLPQMPTPYETERHYTDERTAFVEALRVAKEVSVGCADRFVDRRRGLAALLFTRIVVMSGSVVRLAPRIGKLPEKKANWDLSSLVSVVRNIFEAYLHFFDLCIDDISEDEWGMRANLNHIADNRARKRMLEDLGAKPDPQYEIHLVDLTARLDKNPAWHRLPEKRRTELLKGDKSFHTQDEILDRMGEARVPIRGYYRFLSSHTHTGPISYYRMASQGRGSGVENIYDKKFMAEAMKVGRLFLERATEDMKRIFPEWTFPKSPRPPNQDRAD